MRLGRVTCLTFALAVVAALTALPAWGNHADSMRPTANFPENCATAYFCQTDNNALTYFSESSLNQTSKNTVTSILNNLYNPTDLNVTFQNPPVYTGSAETDNIYRISTTLPLGVAGRAYCDDPIDTIKCDQHYVEFGSQFWAQDITCHETGHAVGLTHPEDASPAFLPGEPTFNCMKNNGQNSNGTGLGTHNQSQINGTY